MVPHLYFLCGFLVQHASISACRIWDQTQINISNKLLHEQMHLSMKHQDVLFTCLIKNPPSKVIIFSMEIDLCNSGTCPCPKQEAGNIIVLCQIFLSKTFCWHLSPECLPSKTLVWHYRAWPHAGVVFLLLKVFLFILRSKKGTNAFIRRTVPAVSMK